MPSFSGVPTVPSQTNQNEKTPNIPSWEWTDLETLSAQDVLSGVDPHILGAIDQAESSGSGGGINSSGYGGYFGLGAGQKYPAGTPSSDLLHSTSEAGFQQQAEIAASEFASLLSSHGGDPYAAERAYQGGSSEGTNIFSEIGVPGNVSGYSPATGATLTASTGSSGGSQGGASYQAAANPIGTVCQYIDGFLNPAVSLVPGWVNLFTGANAAVSGVLSIVDKIVGVAAGVGLVYIGSRVFTSRGNNTILNTIQRQQGLSIARRNLSLGEAKAAAAGVAV